MKTFKVIFSIIVLLIVLAGGVLVAVALNLGGIVKDGVERKGPKITLTPVILSDVDIKLFQGLAELKGFVVDNPAGFNSDYAIKLDLVRIKVDPLSLQGEIIVIEEITVDGAKIIAEQKGMTTNIQALHRAIKQFSDKVAPNSKAEGSHASSDKGEPKFIVRSLSFSNNTMQLLTEFYGEYSLDLPALTRKNLDGASAGLTASELAVSILDPIFDSAAKAAKAKLKKIAKTDVEDKLKGTLDKNLSEDSKDKIQQLKGLWGK